MLKIENLSKIYCMGDTNVFALKKVNLSINDGEFLAVTGASGSGKSTLLHMIAGVDTPSAGTIYINNKNINSISASDQAIFRRRNIGIIYQFFNLIPTLSVEENIVLPLLLDKRKPDREYINSLGFCLQPVKSPKGFSFFVLMNVATLY